MEIVDDREYLTPPDNEAKKIYECYICDSPIYEGEDCFCINDIIYCEDCIDRHFKIIAERTNTSGDLSDLEYHDIK